MDRGLSEEGVDNLSDLFSGAVNVLTLDEWLSSEDVNFLSVALIHSFPLSSELYELGDF